MPVGFDILAHIQDEGDMHAGPGEYAGTRGQGKRMEGFAITLDGLTRGLGLRYQADIKGAGETSWVNGGGFVGTRGQGKAIEGFRIELTGECLSEYDVLYMAHVSGYSYDNGDTSWRANGEYCGVRGTYCQLEGLAVRIVPRKADYIWLVSKATSGHGLPLQITAAPSPRSTAIVVSAPDGSDLQLWDRRPMRGATGYALINRARPYMCISRGDDDIAVLRHVADLGSNDRSIWLDDTVKGPWNAIRSMTELELKLNMRGAPPYADNNNALIVHRWMGAAPNELWQQKKATYDMIIGADGSAFKPVLRTIHDFPAFHRSIFEGVWTFPSSDIHTVRFELTAAPEVSVSSDDMVVTVPDMRLSIEGSGGSWEVMASLECQAEASFHVRFYESDTNQMKLALKGGHIHLEQHQEIEAHLNEWFTPALVAHLDQQLFAPMGLPLIGMIHDNRYQGSRARLESGRVTAIFSGAPDTIIEPRPSSWPSDQVFAGLGTERLIAALERDFSVPPIQGEWTYTDVARHRQMTAMYQINYRHMQFDIAPESGDRCRVRFGLEGKGHMIFAGDLVPYISGTGHVSFIGRFMAKDDKQIVLACDSRDEISLYWRTEQPSGMEHEYRELFRVFNEVTRNQVIEHLRGMALPVCMTASIVASFGRFPVEITLRGLEVNTGFDAENRPMAVISGVTSAVVKRPADVESAS